MGQFQILKDKLENKCWPTMREWWGWNRIIGEPKDAKDFDSDTDLFFVNPLSSGKGLIRRSSKER